MERASFGLLTTISFLLVTLGLAGCAASSEGTGGSGGSGGTGTGAAGSGGMHWGGSNPGGSSGDDCSEASKLVYVIDQDNSLYSFNPAIQDRSAFQYVGTLNCAGDGPNSMSVSREDFAYVLYGDNDPLAPAGFRCVAVHRVEIATARCQGPTPFQCGDSGFNKFGMGYATDGPDTTEETLFLGNSLQAALASLDIATGTVQVRGTLPNQGPEFTGNANGELWGFFPYDTPPTAVHIDKNSGAALQTLALSSLRDVGSGLMAAWAFAYWGGSFYIFYMVNPPDMSTNVYKLEYDGTLTDFILNTGFTIVGAGVSTCAPVEPPH